MATLTWTGAVSNVFLTAGNWNTNSAPASGDAIIIAPVSGAPTPVFGFGGNFEFASITVGSNFTINGETDFTVTGAFNINSGLTTVGGSANFFAGTTRVNGALEINSSIFSGVAALAIGVGGSVTNLTELRVGVGFGTPLPTTATEGSLSNQGRLILTGSIDGDVINSGTFIVDGIGTTDDLTQSSNGSLSIRGQYFVNQNAFLFGDLTLFATESPFSTGRLEAIGDITMALDSLTVDVTGFAGLDQTSAGQSSTEITLVTSVSQSNIISDFSAGQITIAGADSDFSYALRLSGEITSASPRTLSLRALNSAETGGISVLSQSNAVTAITAVFNGVTDRGTIRGGDFWFNRDSLLVGVDRMSGGAAGDSLTVSAGAKAYLLDGYIGADSLRGANGNDTLIGGFGQDTLVGNGGNDSLDGGTDSDSLSGGAGNDTYVTTGGDTITEAVGGGTDTVRASVTHSLGAELENLVLTGADAINGTGNGLDNTMTGNAMANILNGGNGDDTLSGGSGVDRLIGGAGNDTFITEGGDIINELSGGGTDTVRTAVSLTLGAELENLTLTGTAAINGTGNALANTITGNAAANILNGRTGSDRLVGAAGDDTYITDGGDTIVEAVNGGTDTVQASASTVLSANVENLLLTGAAAIAGTGNTLGNTITGNGAANVLNGAAGADTLIGGSGNDSLTGGNDADVLTGGIGADDFAFVSGHGVDRITDFVATGLNSDDIDLRGHSRIISFADLAANHMTASGANVIIRAGTDVITLVNVRLIDLDAGDFIF